MNRIIEKEEIELSRVEMNALNEAASSMAIDRGVKMLKVVS